MSDALEPRPASEPTRLHALAGAAAPTWLARDLACVFELPSDACARLWEVLEPSLDEVIDARTERALDAFTRGFEIPSEKLASTVRSLRFLLRAAAHISLAKALFLDDVAALVGSAAHPSLRAVVERYDDALARVRSEIIGRTLSDHGNLVTSLGWRLDKVGASNHGEPVGVPIAMLSFTYRFGDKEERISLQILPEKLRELRAICDKILS